MDAADWDRRYAAAPQWAAAPARVVTGLLADLPAGSAIDLACGDGRNTRWLADRGWAVTAVDFSTEALRAARAASGSAARVAWVHADALLWAPEAPVDLVLITYLQLPGPQISTVLEHAAGWLRRGGRLVVLGHDLENLATGAPGPRDPLVLLTPKLLAAGARALRIERCERVRRGPDDVEAHRAGADEAAETHVAVDTLLVALR